MNIHEYQAKQLFREFGVPVPGGGHADSGEQAELLAKECTSEGCVVKAQVHAGARGKAGGVKFAKTPDEAKQLAEQMLGTRLVTIQTTAEGLPVESVMIEEINSIKNEFYISLLIDRETERVMFVASVAGGMDIEAVAAETPEKIISIKIHPAAGLQSYQCLKVAKAFGLQGEQVKMLRNIMLGMYQLFLAKDTSQIEINPLVETENGNLMALDAKINFDDNAVAAHKDILALRDEGQEDEKECKAQKFDLNYVTLEGNIACMVNGAGLAMATMDLIKLKGGLPANFLDVGGGTNAEKVAEAFKLILSDEQVKAVLVNIFGGIVQCDVIAKGILAAVKEINLTIPVVVRLEGTNAEQGRSLLNQSDLGLVAAEDLNHAAEQVVALAGGNA